MAASIAVVVGNDHAPHEHALSRHGAEAELCAHRWPTAATEAPDDRGQPRAFCGATNGSRGGEGCVSSIVWRSKVDLGGDKTLWLAVTEGPGGPDEAANTGPTVPPSHERLIESIRTFLSDALTRQQMLKCAVHRHHFNACRATSTA
jgi:hypothetical protein